jgi:hypothetical protein
VSLFFVDMSSGRLFRVTVVALLLAMLGVPALTQPSRRLSPAPVGQGSTFSRIGVLSSDRSPVSPDEASVCELVGPLAVATISPTGVPAPLAAAVLLPADHRLPPTPLRAPPSAVLL